MTRWPLLILAWGCSDVTKIDTLGGRIETDAAIDFGDVQIGLVVSREITVRNTGEVSLSITSITLGENFSTASHTFTVAPTSFALAPGATQIVAASFQPFEEMAAPARSSFELETNALDQDGQAVKAHVDVSGRGVLSGLRVEPNPIDFGIVLIGSSRTLDVVITNDLAAAVELSTPVAGGRPEVIIDAGTGQFSIIAVPSESGSLGMLEPGASITVQARYVPDPNVSGEEDRAHWQVSNCPSPFCAVQVDMRARGSDAALACAPPAVMFGAVNPGVVVTRSIACTNVATDPVEIIDWALDLNSSPVFTAEPFGGATTLQPGDQVSIEVEIAPTLADLASGAELMGELVIRGRNAVTTDGINPVRIALTGSAGGPTIDVLPLQLDFGPVQIGTRDRRFLLVVNNGFDPLDVSAIAATGAEFSAAPTAFMLEAGTSTSVEVWFEPTAIGLVSAELLISSNDASQPQVHAALDGEGIDLGPCVATVTPSSLNYGIIDVGQTPILSFEIENTGAGSCAVNRLESTGDYFRLLNGTPTDLLLPSGDTALIEVEFAPLREGMATGDVSFYVSDPAGSDRIVTLFGGALGTTAIECPPPVVIDAGTQISLTVNATSQTGTVAMYDWNVTAAPPLGIGTPGQWSPDPRDAPTVLFLPRLVGEYQITASVVDGLGFIATCTTAVTALGHGFRVELSWDGLGDVDLHVHNSNPTFWFGRPDDNADDCFYANCSESSNPAGPVWDPLYAPYEGRNPALDIDNIIGFGPENIRVNTVLPGDTFTIALHYFWDHGFGMRSGTVNIYCGRVTVPTMTYTSTTMDGLDQGGCTNNTFWRVATVTFTSSIACNINPIDTYQPSSDACLSF